MSFNAKITAVRVVNALARGRALLARYVRGLMEARRRKIAHEREFYRSLKAYCRANNLPPICEDDWKTAAYDKTDDNLSMINTKGNVS